MATSRSAKLSHKKSSDPESIILTGCVLGVQSRVTGELSRHCHQSTGQMMEAVPRSGHLPTEDHQETLVIARWNRRLSDRALLEFLAHKTVRCKLHGVV